MLNLQQLAELKAQAVRDQRNGAGAGTVEVQHPGFDTNPVHEPNLPGGEGYTSGGLGFGHTTAPSGTTRPSYASDSGIDPRRDNPYGVTSVSQGGLGFSGNPEHFITTGDPRGTPGLTFGHSSPIPTPIPAPAGYSNAGALFNALAGATNTVRGINGTQPQFNGEATNASNMFNALAGINNLVRGNSGTQTPEQLQQTANGYKQQPPSESPAWGQQQPQQPQQPQWSPVLNSATAAGPPGHGGPNPGYSGMLSNTSDTLAALKALIARMQNR